MTKCLYRGKRKDNGKWVKGGISDYGEKVFITSLHRRLGEMGEMYLPEIIEVVPDTVGQYIGLKDDNKKEIFQGDILRLIDTIDKFDVTAVVQFGNPNGYDTWGWQLVQITEVDVNMEILRWVDSDSPTDSCTIIGNIHDNPELLKRRYTN